MSHSRWLDAVAVTLVAWLAYSYVYSAPAPRLEAAPERDRTGKLPLHVIPIDKKEYKHWKKTPTQSYEQFIGLYQNLPIFHGQNLSIGRIDPQFSDYASRIPTVLYLEARTIARSAMSRYTDSVIVFTAPFIGLNDSVLALSASPACSVFPCTFFMLGSGLDQDRIVNIAHPKKTAETKDGAPPSARGPIPLHVLHIEQNNEGIAHALLEISDLMVSASSGHAMLGASLATPTVFVGNPVDKDAPKLPTVWSPAATNLTGADVGGTAGEALMLHLNRRPDVLLHSYLDPYMGYGTSAEQMAIALAQLNADVAFLPLHFGELDRNWQSAVDPRTVPLVVQHKYVPMFQRKRKEAPTTNKVVVPYVYPPTYYLGYFIPHEATVRDVGPMARKAKRAVLYTTFETTQAPVYWPPLVNAYDKLMVSCETIAAAFRNGGVTIPIDIVPLGVDIEAWPYMPRTQPRAFTGDGGCAVAPNQDAEKVCAAGQRVVPTEDRNATTLEELLSTAHRQSPPPFRFLMFAAGEWMHHRKNYQLALDAFNKRFAGSADVELWIKASKVEKEANVTYPPNAHVVVGRLTRDELLQMLRECHAFLCPAHGEGYGLPPREAMATGLPAVFGGFAGLASIANETFNYPVPFTLVPATGYSKWMRDQSNDGSRDFGKWAGIDTEVFSKEMERMARGPAEVLHKGQLARYFIHNNETALHCGKQLWSGFEF